MKPPGNPYARPPIFAESDWHRYSQTPRLNPLPVPVTGIFDSPTRCLTINAEWYGHITGMILTLAERDAWIGDESEVQFAVDNILKLLSEDTCMDAQTIAEGIRLAICCDDGDDIGDGSNPDRPNDPDEGGSDLEPRDGYTEQECAAGGAYWLLLSLNTIMFELDFDLFEGVPGGEAPTQDTIDFVIEKYSNIYDVTSTDAVVALVNSAVQWESLLQYPKPNQTVWEGYIFCNRTNKRLGVSRAIYSEPAGETQLHEQWQLLLAAMTDEQLQDFYDYGYTLPTVPPSQYPCFINPQYIAEMPDFDSWLSYADNLSPTYALPELWEGFPVPRVLSITVSGAITYPDGTVIDMFYRKTPENQLLTSGRTAQFYAHDSLMPAVYPAYKSDHTYKWAVTVTDKGTGKPQLWPNPGNPWEDGSNGVGSITVTIDDFGTA